MKKATTRAMLGVGALLLAITTLAGCSNGAGAGTGSGGGGGDASKAKIGLLLPDSVTARYASADRPLFTAEVKKQCSGCSVVYANADGDASKQLQQAQSMLTQGVKVLVLDPFDGEAAASIVQQAKAEEGAGHLLRPTHQQPGPQLLHLVRQREGRSAAGRRPSSRPSRRRTSPTAPASSW